MISGKQIITAAGTVATLGALVFAGYEAALAINDRLKPAQEAQTIARELQIKDSLFHVERIQWLNILESRLRSHETRLQSHSHEIHDLNEDMAREHGYFYNRVRRLDEEYEAILDLNVQEVIPVERTP